MEGEKHEEEIEGCHLTETIKKTICDNHFKLLKKTIIVRERTIKDDFHGLRSLKVTETFINGVITGNRPVDTEMTSDEVIEFEKDWKKLWDGESERTKSARKCFHPECE